MIKKEQKFALFVRTVACCIWKSSTSSAAFWKYCLDCQDDNFPEWHLDWNNYLTSLGVVLSLSLRNHLSTMCSKNAACEIPYFPLTISIEQRKHNNQNIYKSDEPIQKTSFLMQTLTLSCLHHVKAHKMFHSLHTMILWSHRPILMASITKYWMNQLMQKIPAWR